MDTLLTGAAFGAALTASGVYQPSVIISQLKFENFHMIQTFLTAAGTSAAVVTAANKLGYVQLKPRPYSSIGLFSKADGNIIGGLLLGAGMMLSGACPGTVLAQVGVGVRSGLYALEGCAVAGIVWTGFLHPYLSSSCGLKPAVSPKDKKEDEKQLAVYECLGVSRSTVFLGLEAMFAAIITAAVMFSSVGPEAKIPPVIGGLCIAAAQLLSILWRKQLIGTSTSYEEVGDWFWGILKGHMSPRRYNNILFTVGMTGGAWLLSRMYPALGEVTEVAVSPLAAGLGGFLMVIGSRMAGGCTSGHGISGISLLSTSSFLTIGTAFAAGGLVGLLRG
ncbi:hypothetical protein B0H66DRAFT_264402 [Apodospora peruviana]|uniref:Sulphur transport domain-containing protein n=1 Tax=Apodospora peruviana TaxID=516989 RepID=A0AAE0M621_9PEZI|nr:hypothetical protein B0H66DRAFT_264402 [Apodospora peruviana]